MSEEPSGYQSWEPIDIRTGQRIGVCTYPTEASVVSAITGWKARDARGGRPDLHATIPHISYRRVK